MILQFSKANVLRVKKHFAFLQSLCSFITVIDGLAGLVECKTKDKQTEVVKSRRANKGSK